MQIAPWIHVLNKTRKLLAKADKEKHLLLYRQVLSVSRATLQRDIYFTAQWANIKNVGLLDGYDKCKDHERRERAIRSWFGNIPDSEMEKTVIDINAFIGAGLAPGNKVAHPVGEVQPSKEEIFAIGRRLVKRPGFAEFEERLVDGLQERREWFDAIDEEDLQTIEAIDQVIGAGVKDGSPIANPGQLQIFIAIYARLQQLEIKTNTIAHRLIFFYPELCLYSACLNACIVPSNKL